MSTDDRGRIPITFLFNTALFFILPMSYLNSGKGSVLILVSSTVVSIYLFGIFLYLNDYSKKLLVVLFSTLALYFSMIYFFAGICYCIFLNNTFAYTPSEGMRTEYFATSYKESIDALIVSSDAKMIINYLYDKKPLLDSLNENKHISIKIGNTKAEVSYVWYPGSRRTDSPPYTIINISKNGKFLYSHNAATIDLIDAIVATREACYQRSEFLFEEIANQRFKGFKLDYWDFWFNTLGLIFQSPFGDITPNLKSAKIAYVFQNVCGLLFIAVLLEKLFESAITRNRKDFNA